MLPDRRLITIQQDDGHAKEPDTRYQVDLAGGGELVVVEQNLHTTSMDVLAARGRAVQLVWAREHNRPVSLKS